MKSITDTARTGKTHARKFPHPAIGTIIAGLVVIALVAFAWEEWEDLDNDGMDDAFESFFGLDVGTDDHAGDPDGDLLTNIEENLRGSDPLCADTDLDGWTDNVDSNPVSRAIFLWGEPRFTHEDTLFYIWPAWARAAWAHGGTWLSGEPWGWMSVAPGERLLMHVDRTLVSNDLWLAVAAPGSPPSLLTAGLLDTNLVVVAPPVGLGAAAVAPWFTNRLPLSAHPSASIIAIFSTQGVVHVAASMLYADADGDGLDDDQNVQLALEAAVAQTNAIPPATPPAAPAVAIIGFEADEGYQAGPVAGQLGWTASGEARVATGVTGAIDAQCLLLNRAPVEADHPVIVSRPVDGLVTGDLVWVTLRLAANANGARPPREQLGSASVSFDHDRVVAFDGVSGAWVPSTRAFPAAFTGGWVRVDVALDYAAKTYTVCCEGVATHRGLGFADTSLQRPQWLLFRNDAPSYGADAAMDDIRYATTEPPGLDFDGDGLPNALERELGADPWLADSDGDGIPDGMEYALGGDPLLASCDWDGDGLSNTDEIDIYGTDPTRADSDGDGLPDLYLAADLPGVGYAWAAGSWEVDGETLVGGEGSGRRVAWHVVLPRGGVHGLELKLAGDADFNLALSLDDAPLAERVGPIPATGTVWRIQTPWLPAGTNLLRLIWIEPAPAQRTLSIARIRCFGIDGPDPDGDGFEAWHAAAAATSDGDGDALPDDFETGNARTAPTRLDSDCDGLWDGDERDIFHLDPRHADSDGDGLPDATILATRRGVETAARHVIHLTTDFSESGDALVWDDSTSSACSYDFTVDSPGIHVLELAARNFAYDPPTNSLFDFRVSLYGREVGAVRFIGDIDHPGRGRLLTPWLPAGTHRFRIAWRNRVVDGSRVTRPALEYVRLLAVNGVDADGDGIQDWSKTRLLASTADSDGDGIRDRDEVLIHGTNPLASDSDGDGLADQEELAAGTDPLLADTDGDGLSDGDEIHNIGTDPLAGDFGGAWIAICTRSGSEADRRDGPLYNDGMQLVALGRGVAEFSLDLPVPEKAVMRLAGRHEWRDSSSATEPPGTSEFILYVDGQYCGRHLLHGAVGQDAAMYAVLPFLQGGSHRVRLVWNAIDPRLSLRIASVALGTLGGDDADGDGVRDWVSAYSARINRATDAPGASPLSPVCVEGTARWPMLASAASGSNTVTVAHGVSGRWFANLPLDSSGAATPLTLSFENGAGTAALAVAWTPLDLLSATSLVARVGDTLRVAPLPPEGIAGTASITLATNGVAVASVQTATGVPLDIPLDTAGDWMLATVWTGDNGQSLTGIVTVTVVSATLPVQEPACMLGRWRTWECPGVGTGAAFETDDGATLAWDGTNVIFTVNRMYSEHYIVVRAGAGGPILDSRRIGHFWIQSSVDSFVRIVERRDTSQVWENRMLTLGVPASVDIQLRIFVGGVTFDDLSVVRSLPGANLPEAGDYRFRMIHPDHVTLSVCHSIQAFQGGVLLGEAYHASVGLPADIR